MKFAVKAVTGGRARAGMLHLGPNLMETPALLLSTRKGLPVFISPDLLPCLPHPDSHLLQFSPLHFLDGPCPKTISSIGDCTRCLVKPAEYMEMISSMRPNLWTTLADEVPAWVSDKRNKTSVDRTVKWLDECITMSPAGGAVFGSIVGGSNIEERQRCAQEVAKRNVSGYWIGGFGLAESMDDRPPLLNAVTDNLPEERPRLICGLGLPEEVLQGIAAGVDLFDSAYIYHLTLGGFALIFPLNGMETSDIGSDCTKINLRATMYRKDTTPIVEGCSCYTCQNHTKAYINHLLNVHEMLAQILLEIHNTYHYLGFFRSIRCAIKEGKFEEFQNKFVQSRRSSCILE